MARSSAPKGSNTTDSVLAVRRDRYPPAHGVWYPIGRRFLRHRLALGGALVLLLLTFGTLVGPWLYQRPVDDIDFANALRRPSLAYPMGTDDMGQDVLARVLYGGRVSMAVGIVSMLIAIGLGILVGALAGYCGGAVDAVLMRLTDLFIALPQLPLLLLVIYLFRDTMRRAFDPEMGIFLLIVAVIGGLRWMEPARLVRAAVLGLKTQEFVEAAHAIGATPLRLVLRHILPNAISPVIVAASLSVGSAILAESSLSFLGLGFPPDMPTWGRLLYDAKDFLDSAPHWALFPGLMIFLAVLSINYLGDGLRDALDARSTLQ
jgi:peptide/nickel transport system permease protein